MRHRYAGATAKLDGGVCIRCGTVREVIEIVGIRIHRRLRSYIRPDGVRFTGFAPKCEPRRDSE
jgi:hypothetical protein